MSIFIKLCSRVSSPIIILVMNFSVLFGEENINYEYKDMIKGEELAEVTIIEYASFTCSHCATFHKDVFPKLKKDFIAKGFQILYNNKRESFTTHAYGLFYN